MRFFEVKAKLDRVQENGAVKSVTETYAIASQTFTDAEHKALEALAPYTKGELDIIAEKIAPYDLYLYSETPKVDDKFYLVKYAIVTIDEFTAKEKKEYHHVLIEALDVESATDVFNYMPGDATCRELVSIKQTNIMECFSE